ncbi:hypothetical protein [Actinomadura sp. 9N407]|uniref:hypothetical protein n=1 Tax=Actinomadura sp. 9N407 TaxID=3375154 RepID=UPI0037B9EA4B
MARTTAAERERAEFRAWVRAHHPDVGGDPAEFADGLRRIRGSLSPASPARGTVVAVRRRRWPVRRLARWRERRQRARLLL